MPEDKLNILIKLGKRRLVILVLKYGFQHSRVLRCSHWLDKRIVIAQRKRKAA